MLYNVTAREPAAAARRVCAGYVTVFTFHNPLRATERERPTSLRVCQMLLLPPFQRRGAYVCVCLCALCVFTHRVGVCTSSRGFPHAGLGSRLLGLVYEWAAARDACEVTVEDPADGFTEVRRRPDAGGELAEGGGLTWRRHPRADAAPLRHRAGGALWRVHGRAGDATRGALDGRCPSRAFAPAPSLVYLLRATTSITRPTRNRSTRCACAPTHPIFHARRSCGSRSGSWRWRLRRSRWRALTAQMPTCARHTG